MLFLLICTDRPGAFETRQANRPAHIAYLDSQRALLASAGAMLDEQGRPIGSVLLVDVADQAAAEALAAGDPYAEAGVFASTVIRPFRQVFKDGAKVAA